MSYERPQPPQHQGEYEKPKDQYEPPPPPPPCPDPCDERPPWGPPEIRPECCTHNPCCPEETRCCTWESVEDPCVKAASADCGLPWTKITCTCESSNPDCDCQEWCGSYPEGVCVPCKPCEGLIPDPNDGGCDDPGRDDCTSEDLRLQLDALNQCITSQKNAKAKIEADIAARNDRAAALNELISKFDGILKAYKEQRHKLVCREDCLKGFHRDITAVFRNSTYSHQYLGDLTRYINEQWCRLEQAKCCQKNLEGKLNKVTKLIWEQQEAEKAKQKAEKALEIIKDLPKWLDEKFKELEDLKDQIAQALNDVDPQKHKWAFYLFYWKFVPKLCRCFPFPFCCDNDEGTGTEPPPPQTYGEGGKSEQTPSQQSGVGPKQKPQQYANQPPEPPANHLGCAPGDWHPSAISEDNLRTLICCAWDYARKQKQAYQDATDRVNEVTSHLGFINDKVKTDGGNLDDRIKSGLSKVNKAGPAAR